MNQVDRNKGTSGTQVVFTMWASSPPSQVWSTFGIYNVGCIYAVYYYPSGIPNIGYIQYLDQYPIATDPLLAWPPIGPLVLCDLSSSELRRTCGPVFL